MSAIFIITADFGFDILLTNEISRDRDKALKYFQHYFSLKILFTLASMAGMWLFAILSGFDSSVTTLVVVFSIYMVFTALTNFLFALFKGFERLEYETRVSLFINGICLLAEVEIIYIAFVFVFTRLLGFILGFSYTYKILRNFKLKFQLPIFKEERNKILVYGFHLIPYSSVASSIFSNTNKEQKAGKIF